MQSSLRCDLSETSQETINFNIFLLMLKQCQLFPCNCLICLFYSTFIHKKWLVGWVHLLVCLGEQVCGDQTGLGVWQEHRGFVCTYVCVCVCVCVCVWVGGWVRGANVGHGAQEWPGPSAPTLISGLRKTTACSSCLVGQEFVFVFWLYLWFWVWVFTGLESKKARRMKTLRFVCFRSLSLHVANTNIFTVVWILALSNSQDLCNCSLGRECRTRHGWSIWTVEIKQVSA